MHHFPGNFHSVGFDFSGILIWFVLFSKLTSKNWVPSGMSKLSVLGEKSINVINQKSLSVYCFQFFHCLG